MSFTEALQAVQAAAAAMPTMPTMPTFDTSAIDPTGGSDFGNLLTQGIDSLQGLQTKQQDLAVQAATGDLQSIQDYTITATEASTATQLAVTLRNQAVSAFQQIMQMSV